MILLADKVITKLLYIYRHRLIKKKTGSAPKKIYGNVHIINKNIKFGENVALYPEVMIFGDGPVVIGDNVNIGNGTMIYSSKNGGGVYIGNNTMIAAQSYIIDMDHGIKSDELIRNQKNTAAPIHIGEDVWIAANCTVLKGSIIEDGAIIGAKSLVKGKIEKSAIAVGIPAKVLKYREQ